VKHDKTTDKEGDPPSRLQGKAFTIAPKFIKI